MKIRELISKLEKANKEYGDIDVTISETLWMYNTIKTVLYIKHPYQNDSSTVIELSDCEFDYEDDEWFEKI